MKNPTPFRFAALVIFAFGWALALTASSGFSAITGLSVQNQESMEYEVADYDAGPLTEAFPADK